jgi:hypothetical protein
MKEDFLAYLWKNKLFQEAVLRTISGETTELLDPGYENQDAGPDFFAARVRIGGTLWVGNVELHVRTSDWLRHGHQNDPAYDNIILHVVYEHDLLVFTSGGKQVPVLELKNLISQKLVKNYQNLIGNPHWIACQKNITEVDTFFVNNWLNRLLVERLERKSAEVLHFLEYFSHSWDQTFYYLLARNFGFKINASPFGLLAQRTPFSVLARNSDNFMALEAILFGQAGLLNQHFKDVYPRMLLREYSYQQKKFNLKPVDPSLWKFAKLRPVNFPTIRISQFAMLLFNHQRIFSLMMDTEGIEDVMQLLKLKASPYWADHYTFDKSSVKVEKSLGTQSVYNIIINTIAPVQFVYGNLMLKPELRENAVALYQGCPPESNSIISKWTTFGIRPQNAADTQALIELRKYYCTPKKCLRCPIGHVILNG